LNDVAFHLLNKLNKKKLKINTLLTKNWKIIFGEHSEDIELKKVSILGQSDSLKLEFKINSSKSFELHSIQREIILKCEEILGLKINKIQFFHDFLSKKNVNKIYNEKIETKKLKDVNNQKLNDIKDAEVRAIFKDIFSKTHE
tara:strand:- start:3842 stop:4270 length:429 start_codon:yes stop_codon:yes gene_type:complete